jgi:PTH2 family peptidyl-tRNA hydrolase
MSKHYETKQVILMRTDLRNGLGQKVRSGKLMAQAAHASMIWLSKRIQHVMREEEHLGGSTLGRIEEKLELSVPELSWMRGSFAKIVVGVDSMEALNDLVAKAKWIGVAAEVVTDAGMTEFDGVPTVTCAAIGPGPSHIIDNITGHLKPL